MTGMGAEVTRVVTNLTVGPDALQRLAIYIGGEEPAHKKLWPTMGGKAPQKELFWAAPLKKPQKYQQGMVALCKIHQFQKSTELLTHKRPFSMK